MFEDFTPDPKIFHEEFREHIKKINLVPVGHEYKRKAFSHKVSVENIKPAFFLRDVICNVSPDSPTPKVLMNSVPTVKTNARKNKVSFNI